MANRSRGTRGGETRVRLLDAGLTLLKDEPTERLFEVVSPRRVIAKASSSAGAYYHHFSGQDTYLDQLMEYALARSPVPELVASSQAFEEVLGAGGSFDEAIVAGGVAALHIADTDTTVPLQLLVRAKASRDPAARERLIRMYDLVTSVAMDYYAMVLDRSPRELRPPYTIKDIAIAIVALYEGLMLRRAVERDAVPDTCLGGLMMAVLELYTRPRLDAADRGEWLHRVGAAWGTNA